MNGIDLVGMDNISFHELKESINRGNYVKSIDMCFVEGERHKLWKLTYWVVQVNTKYIVFALYLAKYTILSETDYLYKKILSLLLKVTIFFISLSKNFPIVDVPRTGNKPKRKKRQ